MKKIILQGFVMVIAFFSTWWMVKQADWMTIFKVKKITQETEKKLGDLFWNFYKTEEKEHEDPFVAKTMDSIVNKLCVANKIDRNTIKLHVLDKEEVNAFALPDGHLVVHSGLILAADNPEELSGVVAHEIAHIQLNHVMKKLVKETGLATLLSITTGNGSGILIQKTAQQLSSAAFDRNMEKAADIQGVEYLVNAHINPAALANFLYTMDSTNKASIDYLSWLATHPDSKERAAYIIEATKDKPSVYEPILTKKTWQQLKESVQE